MFKGGKNIASLKRSKNLENRKTKIAEILTTYAFDQYNNKTIQ